jgi:hypothetical protein
MYEQRFMRALDILAFVLLGLAVIVVGIGLTFTAGLIKEYGANVSPIQLAAQAAVVWVPASALLALVGDALRRRVKRK